MMTKDEWDSLSGSSGWAAMRGYLMDARSRLVDTVMDGTVPPLMRDEAIFRAQNLKDLAEMDWKTIANFYNIPEPEPKKEKNA